jgi:SPP1 family predicted phage head-tail adaptor
VIIQQFSGVTDADTEADTDAGVNWTTFATVWASITPSSGTAIGAPNNDLQGVTEYLVAIRYYSGVTNGMQVVDTATGLTLDVLAVLDINEIHRQMHLQCVARKYPPV